MVGVAEHGGCGRCAQYDTGLIFYEKGDTGYDGEQSAIYCVRTSG